MKSTTSLRRELARVEEEKRRLERMMVRQPSPMRVEDYHDLERLYGAETALAWALGQEVAPPGKAFGRSGRRAPLARRGGDMSDA
jgi:hypothetical protein